MSHNTTPGNTPHTRDTITDEAHAVYTAAMTVKETGGAVEIAGVRIEPCDTYGQTDTTQADARAVPADDDTALMRQAAASERAAERHWPADMLLQAAHTITALRAEVDRLRALPADHTATTDDAARAALDAWDSHKPDPGKTMRENLLDAMKAALAAAGLLVTARPDTTTEWGKAFRQADGSIFVDDEDGSLRSREEAMQFVKPENPESPYDFVVRREVTPWIEADHG